MALELIIITWELLLDLKTVIVNYFKRNLDIQQISISPEWFFIFCKLYLNPDSLILVL